MSSTRRFTLFIIIVLVLALLAGGYLWWRATSAKPQSGPTPTPTATMTVTPSPTPTAAAETATLLVEEGQVEVVHQGLTTIVDDEAEIVAGDNVRTMADSKATIVFPDNDLMRLDSNTEIYIVSLISSDTESKVEVSQSSGNTWSRVESLLDRKREYSVDTATLVATVRGTVFNVDVESSEESWVGVTESTVDVERKADQAMLPVNAGNFASVKKAVRSQLGKLLQEKLDNKKLTSDWFKNNGAKDKKLKDFLEKEKGKKLAKNFLREHRKMFFEKILKAKLSEAMSGALLPTTGVASFDPKAVLHSVLNGFVAEKKATQNEANTMEADPYAQERIMTMKGPIEIASFVADYLKRMRSNPSPSPTATTSPSPEPTPTETPKETSAPTHFNPQYYNFFTPTPTQEPIK